MGGSIPDATISGGCYVPCPYRPTLKRAGATALEPAFRPATLSGGRPTDLSLPHLPPSVNRNGPAMAPISGVRPDRPDPDGPGGEEPGPNGPSRSPRRKGWPPVPFPTPNDPAMAPVPGNVGAPESLNHPRG